MDEWWWPDSVRRRVDRCGQAVAIKWWRIAARRERITMQTHSDRVGVKEEFTIKSQHRAAHTAQLDR